MCSTLMKSLESKQPKRSGARSLIPLFILIAAGGLWVWGSIANQKLDRTVAVTVEQAAHAVCDGTPMPSEIKWLIPSLKSDFIEAIKPHCERVDADSQLLSAHAARGDIEGASGQASHTATISLPNNSIVVRFRITTVQ